MHKYELKENPLGGVVLDENGRPVDLNEIVDKLNDGEKYKVLFEIAREIIRNNLSQRYVDYLMRAEFQQFWEDLGNLEPVWGRCRCNIVPNVKEENNDLEG